MRLLLLLLALLLGAPTALAAKTILIVGDSLSAGYGLRLEEAWPSLLAGRLAEQHFDYSVANISISGETTAGGRSRLASALREHKPVVVVIALGANDGLRGLALEQMRDNLDAMIVAAQQAGARVLLVGMLLPPNYGSYADQFQAVFVEVAQARQTALLPFLLEPAVSRPQLFQADNRHPTAAAQPLILDHLWPALAPLLK